MNGELHLVCGSGRNGRSVLLGERFNAPMHVSKPYWEERLLVVNAVNATAGLFAGDTIRTEVQVQAGGEMLLTSPSANRIHRTGGGFAESTQLVQVESGGWLEGWPSMLIPHAGSDFRQKTRLEVEPGGGLLWFEYFAPGRVASGEAWQFTRLQNDFEFIHDGDCIAKERYSLTPGSAAVSVLTRQFPTAYCASAYAAGQEISPEIAGRIAALHGSDCWVGCTRLRPGAMAARLVAAGSIPLMRALHSLRQLFHLGLGRTALPIRRV